MLDYYININSKGKYSCGAYRVPKHEDQEIWIHITFDSEHDKEMILDLLSAGRLKPGRMIQHYQEEKGQSVKTNEELEFWEQPDFPCTASNCPNDLRDMCPVGDPNKCNTLNAWMGQDHRIGKE